jgi:general secretion pathway protein G
MSAHRRNNKGFTLVEILIVVIILGILAAIVIPQFTNASTDAKKNSLTSQLQTIRSQIELYKLQHNEQLPDFTNLQWVQMTGQTDVAGDTQAATGRDFGPYLQQTPANPLNNNTLMTVITGADPVMGGANPPASPVANAGFVINSDNCKVWATNVDAALYFDESTGELRYPSGN